MRFLADENVDQEIVVHLRHGGHEVLYVAEMEPGISDEEVFSRSNQNPAILITSDKDFGEIVFRQKRSAYGVILFRLAGLSAERKSLIVSEAIRDHESELLRNFTVISPGRVRIRKSEH